MKNQEKANCIHCGYEGIVKDFYDEAIQFNEGDVLVRVEVKINICPQCKEDDAMDIKEDNLLIFADEF
ncbi:UNVERIFIED_CONTAM: hypothetical protein BEN50_17065 [Euhalothece sp. KZN 001]